MSKIRNISYDLYNIENIKYSKYLIKDCSAKKKEFVQDKSKEPAINIKNIGYISLYYNQNPLIYVTTPVMVCLFGMKNQIMSLQFTNLKTDKSMESFFNFIKNIELNNMINLGITDEENADKYNSQIRYDKDGKYDPNLVVKVPFVKNCYDIDIYSDDYDTCNIKNLNNFTKMKCDIYIDKIWKFNEQFICKWKAKVIYLV
jgi:hypothetical protein